MGWSLLSLETTAFTRSLSLEEIKFSLVQSLRDQELLDLLRPKHRPSWANLNYLLIFFPQLPFSLLLSLTIDEGPGEGLGSAETSLGTHQSWAYLYLNRVFFGSIPIILLLALHELPEVFLDEECGVELPHCHLVVCGQPRGRGEGQWGSHTGLRRGGGGAAGSGTQSVLLRW